VAVHRVLTLGTQTVTLNTRMGCCDHSRGALLPNLPQCEREPVQARALRLLARAWAAC
jgi:hypothetical protein